jgi:choice-of-anchor C domain-containing protein
MKFSKLALTALIAISGVAANASSNLVINGSFEAFTDGNPVNGYKVVSASSTALTGWTVGGTSVDVINGNFGAITGNSIDMLGSPGPGSLSQSLTTSANTHYVLSFDLRANTAGLDDGTLNVDFGSGVHKTFLGTTGTPVHYSFDVLATSESTLLTFASGNTPKNGGSVLDNVSVTAVPEPETYAMLLAGLGLMAGIARRRKNTSV